MLLVQTSLRRGVLDYVVRVCQWLATGRWFSLGTPVSSINKTDRHDITEILLKVVLNTIILTLTLLQTDQIFILKYPRNQLIIIRYIYNIRTLSVNIKFICTSFRNRQNSEPLASFSGLFCREYKWILYLTTMYVFCVYPAMSKKSENLSDLNKKDRNKRHSSPFINVVKGVFFVVRVN
jgi:low temperature requirement protein LtrA